MNNLTKQENPSLSSFLINLSENDSDGIGLKGKQLNDSLAFALFVVLKKPPQLRSEEEIKEMFALEYAKKALIEQGFSVQQKDELVLENRIDLIWKIVSSVYGLLQRIHENPIKLRKLLDTLTYLHLEEDAKG